jgi:syndecan 4
VAVNETSVFTFQCDLAEPCDPRVRCTNLNPGFRCDPCPPGYTGSVGVEGIGLEEAYRKRQQCYDIDECNDGRNGGCTENSICNNIEVCFLSFKHVTSYISTKH